LRLCVYTLGFLSANEENALQLAGIAGNGQ
jgi:hypothetical protein